MHRKALFLVFGFLLIPPLTFAQEISPKGKFVKDSVLLGEPITYSLTVKYPKNLQFIFPDSTYNFYPFEFVGRKYSPTRSDSLYSFDSVAYSLRTFEISKAQSLALPIYMLSAGDSIPIVSASDTVFLIELISHASDTLALQENLAFREVPTEFNYPYLIFGFIAFVAVVVGTYFIFGNIIVEKIKKYKLKRAHQRFKSRYSLLLESFKNKQANNPEEILIIWKKYMEELEGLPYTKQTSKEIWNSAEHETLKNSLRAIDRSIYGDIFDQNLIDSFHALSEYSEGRYKSKVQEVTHG